MDGLKAPFPWFGGKSKVAHLVWERFGEVENYVEPFFGSGAVLLNRPGEIFGIETINDYDGFLANFWRSIKNDPESVAYYADEPIHECDLHAKHAWLVGQRENLVPQLEGDPDFYDPKIAGWWVWGVSIWIGSGFCSGKGPWHQVDGLLIRATGKTNGVARQLPHLGSAGRGVNRQLPHLGSAGQGINRQLPDLYDYFDALSERLRNVRVCCGDWSRVCGPSVTTHNGLTGIFLDPPYSAAAGRESDLYAVDNTDIAVNVREWAIANGNNPKLRIALCGYEGEHTMPPNWACVAWKAHGGYGNQGNSVGRENKNRERIWFSPHCFKKKNTQMTMFVKKR